MFSFGKTFMELWEKIPTIINYQDYVWMANEIDDAKIRGEITERDEDTLLDTLGIVRVAREILDE